MKILTFLTDFGTKSSYLAQMKGVALSITDARLVDITHEISPQNIREGSFVLSTAVKYFPAGTVHVAVVDPGVGTERRGIVVTTAKYVLVGPDNGLLMPTAHNLGEFAVYEIKNTAYMLPDISNTFHGRDIFTPIAANILNGLPFNQIGPQIKDYVDLNFGKAEFSSTETKGKIIFIDNFGNIITNIEIRLIKGFIEYGKKIRIKIKNKQHEIIFTKSYNFVEKGNLIATIGSSKYLEISINQGNAAQKLDVKIDDEIQIEYS